MSGTTRVRTRNPHALGSLTASGAPREWIITESAYWGAGVPRLAPRGFVEPIAHLTATDVTVSRYYSEAYARAMLSSYRREAQRLARLDAEEHNRPQRGRIYTHPRVISQYVGTDQSVAVGGSRAGEAARWHRFTYVTRTRDGVTYTHDITISLESREG